MVTRRRDPGPHGNRNGWLDSVLGVCPTENFHPNQLWSVVMPDPRCGQKIGDFRSVGQTPRVLFF